MRLQVQGRSSGSEDLSKQPGVVRADILRAAWTKKTLAAAFIAYVTSVFSIIDYADVLLFSLAFATFFQTLEQYTTRVYQAYATSDFKKHSLLTTSDVLEKIITLVAYPITAKLSDVFGRTEGLALNVWFMVLGEIMKAASPNVQTWVVCLSFHPNLREANETKPAHLGRWGIFYNRRCGLRFLAQYIHRRHDNPPQSWALEHCS